MSAVLTGCTTSIETRPVAANAPRIDGTEYWLPALELELPITRRLIDCASRKISGGGQDVEQIVPEFEFKLEPKQEFVASERFALDYSRLSKPWKTADFEVEWHDNRMLKEINVSAKDHSGEIALETLKAGVGLAKLVGGIPTVAGAAAAMTPACPAQVATRESLLAQRKTASAALDTQTAIAEAFNARAADTLSENDKIALSAAVTESRKQSGLIADIEKKLAELDKILAHTETVRWRPAAAPGSSASQGEVFDFGVPNSAETKEDAARIKWLKRLFGIDDIRMLGRAGQGCEDIDVDADGSPDSFRCRLERSLAVAVRLDPESTAADVEQVAAINAALGLKRSATPKARRAADHVDGVVTRTPVRSRLYACSGLDQPCHRASATKLFDQLVAVPQLGSYLVLPFRNGFGQDNTLEATFAENGLPISVSYKEKSASALVAAQTANQGTELLLGYAADVRAFRKAKEEEKQGAELEAAEAQRKLLEERLKIVTIQAALNPADVELAQQKNRLDVQHAILGRQLDIAKIELEIEALDLQLLTQPGDLALLREKERLETRVASLRSQSEIAQTCAEQPDLEACTT